MPDNNDPELVLSGDLKSAIVTLQDLLGKPMTESLFETLKEGGIDLSNSNEKFYMRDVRVVFEMVFGVDAAELLIQRIAKELMK